MSALMSDIFWCLPSPPHLPSSPPHHLFYNNTRTVSVYLWTYLPPLPPSGLTVVNSWCAPTVNNQVQPGVEQRRDRGGGGGGDDYRTRGRGGRTIHSSHGTWQQHTGKKHVLSKTIRYLKNTSKTSMQGCKLGSMKKSEIIQRLSLKI